MFLTVNAKLGCEAFLVFKLNTLDCKAKYLSYHGGPLQCLIPGP